MSNTGIFSPKDINDLTSFGQWSGMAGQLELIETQSFAIPVSVVDFLNIKEDQYNVHFITLNTMKSEGDNQEVINFRFYENGVLEDGSNTYERARQTFSNIPSQNFSESRTTSDSRIGTCFGTGNATGEGMGGYAYFYNLGDKTKYSFCTAQVTGLSNDAHYMGSFGSYMMKQTSVVDGIRVYKNSGNYSNFDISLYGIRFSS